MTCTIPLAPRVTVKEYRTEVCEACGGDGGWDVPHDFCHVTGALIERWRECRACEGTGKVKIVPVAPEDAEEP